MPEISDPELVVRLLRATRSGKLGWEKTADPERFVASYGGKWSLTIEKTMAFDDEGERSDAYSLTINNTEGEEILRIWDQPKNAVRELFEQARRHALKVNEALDDLMKAIGESREDVKDEDIPF